MFQLSFSFSSMFPVECTRQTNTLTSPNHENFRHLPANLHVTLYLLHVTPRKHEPNNKGHVLDGHTLCSSKSCRWTSPPPLLFDNICNKEALSNSPSVNITSFHLIDRGFPQTRFFQYVFLTTGNTTPSMAVAWPGPPSPVSLQT